MKNYMPISYKWPNVPYDRVLSDNEAIQIATSYDTMPRNYPYGGGMANGAVINTPFGKMLDGGQLAAYSTAAKAAQERRIQELQREIKSLKRMGMSGRSENETSDADNSNKMAMIGKVLGSFLG